MTPQEQAQVDDLGRQSRDLQRQSQAEAAKKNTDTAAKLSAQANDLAMKVRAIRATHLEKASPLMDDARAQYNLTNLKPGDADHAMSVKPDPKFPDFSTPNRIQSISVLFSFGVDPKNAHHGSVGAEDERHVRFFGARRVAALVRFQPRLEVVVNPTHGGTRRGRRTRKTSEHFGGDCSPVSLPKPWTFPCPPLPPVLRE